MQISRNRFKLSFYGEPKFHTSISGKTGKMVTTCVLRGEIVSPEFDNGYAFNVFDTFSNDMVVTAVGKVTCSANDKPSLEIGKAVAQAKAETKCYARAKKIIEARIQKATAVFQSALTEFSIKTENVRNHNEDYIDTVTDPASDLYKRKTQ